MANLANLRIFNSRFDRKNEVGMADLIYPELSYKINGIAYKIDNEIGFGMPEKIYSTAFEKLLIKEGLVFRRELYCPVKIDDEIIGRKYLDFLIDGIIVVELKIGNGSYLAACKQIYQYLKISNLKLGIIIRFTNDGVKIKRIVNLK